MNKSWNTYVGMTRRNVLVYYKDKVAVFFSLLTPIIVLGLYVLFLKDSYTSGLSDLKKVISADDIDAVINSWLIAGVLGTAVVTVALNSFSTMVSDRQNKIDYDYKSTPAKSYCVVLSYLTAAVINTFIMCAVILTVSIVVLSMSDIYYGTAADILKTYGIVALGSVSSSLILMFLTSFIKKSSTLSSFGTIISTAVGFVIGAYVPVSQFDESVQNMLNLVPGSQIAGMLRQKIMGPTISSITDQLSGSAKKLVTDNINVAFSVDLKIFGDYRKMNFMIIYSVAAIALFLVLNLIVFRFNSKNKD